MYRQIECNLLQLLEYSNRIQVPSNMKHKTMNHVCLVQVLMQTIYQYFCVRLITSHQFNV